MSTELQNRDGSAQIGVLAVGMCLLFISSLALAQRPALDDLPVGQWTIISENTISDVDPCPARNCAYSAVEGQSGVVDDWNGGAFAPNFGEDGGLIAWGGGHNGYFGNEVYMFDINTGLWGRLSEPVENPVCNYQESELQDGSPCTTHTYDSVNYDPLTNSFIKISGSGDHDGITSSPRVHMFDITTGEWRRGARKPSFPDSASGEGASSAYDPNRGVVWYLPSWRGNRFGKFDPVGGGSEGQWTEYGDYDVEIDATSAIDPVRDLFVTVDGRGAGEVIVHDLKNPSGGATVVSTTGDLTAQRTDKVGFAWDSSADRFVAWTNGADVYVLTPPIGNWRTGTWVWERVSPDPANTNVPRRNVNGTFSRFDYVPKFNAFILVNSTRRSVFMYKLSAEAGTPLKEPEAPAELVVQ